MTSSKKYSIQIEKVKSTWTANIVRKVSATTTNISKSHDKFKTKKEASAWAEKTLSEFTQTQANSNVRKTEQRANTLKSRQDRSERRATKTAEIKAKKALEETEKNEVSAEEAQTD